MATLYDQFLTNRTLASTSSEELITIIRGSRQGGSERVEAAWMLGYRRCLEAVPALLEMLRDGWYTDSVAAAEALVRIGDTVVTTSIESVYAECKADCSGTHIHFTAKRLHGILAVLLRLRSVAELKRLLQEGDQLEGWGAGRELEVRRSTKRLRELLSQLSSISEAASELHTSGEVQGWTVPLAVESITGLPFEDARYLVVCALQSRKCI